MYDPVDGDPSLSSTLVLMCLTLDVVFRINQRTNRSLLATKERRPPALILKCFKGRVWYSSV